MKPKTVLVLLLLLSGTVAAFATPQISDILVYEGKNYSIDSDFLDDYFKRFPERNPKDKEDGWCSANWRGYRATFEAIKGKIYLKDVHINVCVGEATSVLKIVVPDGEKLFIDWASELIVSGYGQNSEDPYSYHEYEDAFANYSFFQVENGNIVEVRQFDNKGYRRFKKKQFEAYRKTKEYELDVKRSLERNPQMTKIDADRDIEMRIFSTTKKFLVK